MPKGRFTITEVDQAGEPIEPIKILGPYKTAIGCIVRDTIPIKYRFWKSKREAQWEVPESIKEIAWEKLREKFRFPEGTENLSKRRALLLMGNSFKNFRCELNKLVKKGEEPDWTIYPNQRDFWPEFVEYKTSTDAKSLSQKNTENARKNLDHHRTGSRGYARKIPDWERQADELEKAGVTLQTDSWEPRAVRYLLGHGASYNPDGTLSFRTQSAEEVSHRIEQAAQEVSQGVFKPDRENDTLTRALGTKEHGGRTRGTGIIPWRIAFEDDTSYKSRSRRKAAQDDLVNHMMERVRQECEASNAKLREELEQRYSQRQIDDGAQVLGSPALNRSSCGSTGVPEQDARLIWPVDEIDGPKNCKLYAQLGPIKT